MEKYTSENIINIKSMIQEKTGVSFARSTQIFVMRKYVILAMCLMCFISLSAFGYYKFNSLSGDDLALSSTYLGDGKYEVVIKNMSEHELKLQDKIKVMQWSTGSEVEGKKNAVRVEACEIASGETGIVKIDLSEAYDIEQLKGRLADNDWYYFVLTNNGFAFGQDWMCSFDFNIKNASINTDLHNSFTEYVDDSSSYIPTYEEGILTFEDWASPVKNMKISCYFGKQSNGAISDHINISGIEGEEIYAVSNGTVAEIGFDSIYGNYIVLAVDDNTSVIYGHLKSVNVSKNDVVAINTVIGYMGKTGSATGVNLSFAVIVDGEYINPIK